MKWGVFLGIFFWVGFLATGVALGNPDFDVHDEGIVKEDLSAPDLTEENETEKIKQYEEALDFEEQRSLRLPDVEKELEALAESGLEGQKERFEEMVKELPFVLLAKSLDGDGDGLSKEDEKRLKTKSTSMDTDGDGFIDGLEVVRGYNPTVASPDDKVVYGEVSDAAVSQGKELYKVTGIRVVSKVGDRGPADVLVITGIAPANTLVMLFVSSGEREVWVARADESGRFQYSSSDTLNIGNHKIQAVATDAGGKVLMASETVEFTRTIDGIDIIKGVEFVPISEVEVEAAAGGPTDTISLGAVLFIGGIVLAIVLVIGVVWYAIKWWKLRKTKRDVGNIERTKEAVK